METVLSRWEVWGGRVEGVGAQQSEGGVKLEALFNDLDKQPSVSGAGTLVLEVITAAQWVCSSVQYYVQE